MPEANLEMMKIKVALAQSDLIQLLYVAMLRELMLCQSIVNDAFFQSDLQLCNMHEKQPPDVLENNY